MIAIQGRDDILFWPEREIASWRPDFGGRWQVVLSDGSVGHSPGAPRADGPWVEVAGGRVHPEKVVRVRGGWQDPAGFVFAGPASLESVPPAPAEVPLEGLPCLPSEVVYLEGIAGQAVWHTDRGEFPAGDYASAVAHLHPRLIPAGAGCYVNQDRLRRVRADQKRFWLLLDTGLEISVSYGAAVDKTAAALGLPHLYYLEPYPKVLYREGLRDWPLELQLADSAFLHEHFAGDARRLLGNLLWQTVRGRAAGLALVGYGRDTRSFFYKPVKATLYRAGFGSGGRLGEAKVIWPVEPEPDGRPAWKATLIDWWT